MNLHSHITLSSVFASVLCITLIAGAADQPPLAPATPVKKGALKLRTVEAVPGKPPESGPAIGGVTLTVLDGEDSKRSQTLWNAMTDERGEATWSQPVPLAAKDSDLGPKQLFVRASKGGYQSATRRIDPAAGEEIVALSKWAPWMVRAVDAQTKAPIPTFTVMNRLLSKLTTKYGPTTARDGEALAGFFSEHTIRPRQLTIEAPGYETFQTNLTPTLGATNTYELKPKPAAP